METNNTAGATVLAEKVAKIKAIARDSLRMKLISPRQSKIATLEGDIVSVKKDIEETTHDTKVEKYEISKLDTEHPNYEKTKTDKENIVKSNDESIINLNKEIENINKAIIEQKDGIAKIESGETKVSLDELNELVDSLIKTESREEVKIEVA